MEFMETRKPKTSLGSGFIGGIILLVMGFSVNPLLSGLISEAKESENWPTAKGKIIASEIWESRSENSDGHLQTMYSPYVEVIYIVDSMEFYTSRINMGGDYSTSSRNGVKKTLAPYPVGAEVDVYYDPEDPGYALLEPGLTFLFKVLTIIPYFLIGLGVLLLIKALLKLAGVVAALGFLAHKQDNQKSNTTTVPKPVMAKPVPDVKVEISEKPFSEISSLPSETPADSELAPDKKEGDGFSI